MWNEDWDINKRWYAMTETRKYVYLPGVKDQD